MGFSKLYNCLQLPGGLPAPEESSEHYRNVCQSGRRVSQDWCSRVGETHILQKYLRFGKKRRRVSICIYYDFEGFVALGSISRLASNFIIFALFGKTQSRVVNQGLIKRGGR